MKYIGIAIIVIGLAMTFFSGVSIKREEELLEIGEYELTREEEEDVNWPRWAGLTAIGAGVIILVVAGKKKNS